MVSPPLMGPREIQKSSVSFWKNKAHCRHPYLSAPLSFIHPASTCNAMKIELRRGTVSL